MHLDPTAVLTQFLGTLPTFIAVVLAWMLSHSPLSDVQKSFNSRMSDLQKSLNGRIEDTRDLLRAEFRV